MAKINYEHCDKCGKINHVFTHETDSASKQAVLDKHFELKNNNNFCEGNCSGRRPQEDDPRNYQLETYSSADSIKDYFQNYNVRFIKLSDDGKRLLINGEERTPGVSNIICQNFNVKE